MDSDGEVVWEFGNPNLSEDGHPIVIVRARRVPHFDVQSMPMARVD